MATWAMAAAPQYAWAEGMLSLRAALDEPALAGLSDAEVAEALNARRTAPQPVDVPCRTVRSVLRRTGDLGALVLRSRAAPTGNAQADRVTAAAIVATDTVLDSTGVIGGDAESVEVFTQMTAAFVQAGIFQQATADRLLALGQRDFPVWDPPVTAANVAEARGL